MKLCRFKTNYGRLNIGDLTFVCGIAEPVTHFRSVLIRRRYPPALTAGVIVRNYVSTWSRVKWCMYPAAVVHNIRSRLRVTAAKRKTHSTVVVRDRVESFENFWHEKLSCIREERAGFEMTCSSRNCDGIFVSNVWKMTKIPGTDSFNVGKGSGIELCTWTIFGQGIFKTSNMFF